MLDPEAPRHATLSEQQQRRRVMIIGDVHGCCDELRELLGDDAPSPPTACAAVSVLCLTLATGDQPCLAGRTTP